MQTNNKSKNILVRNSHAVCVCRQQGRPQADALDTLVSSKFGPQFNFLCNFSNDRAVQLSQFWPMICCQNDAALKAFDASGHRRIALAFD